MKEKYRYRKEIRCKGDKVLNQRETAFWTRDILEFWNLISWHSWEDNVFTRKNSFGRVLDFGGENYYENEWQER